MANYSIQIGLSSSFCWLKIANKKEIDINVPEKKKLENFIAEECLKKDHKCYFQQTKHVKDEINEKIYMYTYKIVIGQNIK